jgi:hypothetical protein
MTTKTRFTAGLAGLFLAALALASGGSAGTAAFTDPGGDGNGAPDITAISMTDVAGTGAITVSVTASGLEPSTAIEVWLDTDKNSSTGSPCGCEYNLEIWQEADDWGWTIDKWNGTTWVMTAETPGMRFARSGDVFTWTFNKSDLGGANGFAFWAGGYLMDATGDNVRNADYAPDGGTWVYDLSGKAVQVTTAIGNPVAIPAKPRAGKLLSLAFPVTRSDNGQLPSGATITATTKVGGVSISHTQSLNGGMAAVNVLVPKSAKGKLLTVTVRIAAGGQTTTKVVSFRVS